MRTLESFRLNRPPVETRTAASPLDPALLEPLEIEEVSCAEVEPASPPELPSLDPLVTVPEPLEPVLEPEEPLAAPYVEPDAPVVASLPVAPLAPLSPELPAIEPLRDELLDDSAIASCCVPEPLITTSSIEPIF